VKQYRILSALAILALVALACAPTVSSFKPPSVMTLEARQEATATVAAVTDLKIKGAPVIASPTTTQEKYTNDMQFLEGFARESYDSSALSQAGQTYTYTVALEKDQAVLFGTNWCTTTQTLLVDNWSHITLKFIVNDTLVGNSQFTIVEYESQQDNLICRSYFTLLYDWPEGEHVLLIKVTFDEQINDGLADYPAGTHTYEYEVTVK
jgi:hypothetical protein